MSQLGLLYIMSHRYSSKQDISKIDDSVIIVKYIKQRVICPMFKELSFDSLFIVSRERYDRAKAEKKLFSWH